MQSPYHNARPGSLASTIKTDSPDGCSIALLGLPDDTGVKLNNGRPGAKDGPAAFRNALARYGLAFDMENRHSLDLDIYDAGDVQPGNSLEETHDRVTKKMNELLAANLFPICVGGGHDLTWPCIHAVAKHHESLTGVYFDAHLDVREEPGSGMPFRKILTETNCSDLRVVGLDAFSNSQQHLEWFEANGGRIDYGEFQNLDGEATFISFDMDCLNVAYAPGVSAINTGGFDPWEVQIMIRQLIETKNVIYFDFMELNPAFDMDGRTARLAVRLFLTLLSALQSR